MFELVKTRMEVVNMTTASKVFFTESNGDVYSMRHIFNICHTCNRFTRTFIKSKMKTFHYS